MNYVKPTIYFVAEYLKSYNLEVKGSPITTDTRRFCLYCYVPVFFPFTMYCYLLLRLMSLSNKRCYFKLSDYFLLLKTLVQLFSFNYCGRPPFEFVSVSL